MNKKIFLITLMLITVNIIFANSIFSFYGMPTQTYGVDTYALGMGETGFSDLFRINSSYSNPSIMVTSSKITIATSSTFGFIWYKDSYGSYRDDTQYFPYFNIAVPLKNHKLGFSFNSVLSGNFDTEQSSVYSEDGTDFEYTEIHRIDANVFKTSLLYAFKNKYVNFGISGDIYLGHRIKYWKVDFVDDYFNDATYEHEEDLKNLGYSIGLSKKISDFSIGGYYKSSSRLYGEVVNRYNFSPGTDTLYQKKDDLFLIPQTYGAGITFKKDIFKISLETVYENYKSDDQNSENSIKYSFGIAYDPILGYGSWINNIPLRFGLSYKTMPFKVNNSLVREKKVTFGGSIPLHYAEKIDIAIAIFKRGDTTTNGVQDTGISLNIGINAFDIFSKRHRRIKPREIPKKEF